MAEACAGDKLINLKNEKQLLGGPKEKTKKQTRNISEALNRFAGFLRQCSTFVN